jgi:hypothetical protein
VEVEPREQPRASSHVLMRQSVSLGGGAKGATMSMESCGSTGAHLSRRWSLGANTQALTRSSGGFSLGVAGTWCLGYRQRPPRPTTGKERTCRWDHTSRKVGTVQVIHGLMQRRFAVKVHTTSTWCFLSGTRLP